MNDPRPAARAAEEPWHPAGGSGRCQLHQPSTAELGTTRSKPCDRNDVLIGGPGDDSIVASGGNDQIDSSAGNDSTWGGSGTDTSPMRFGTQQWKSVRTATSTTAHTPGTTRHPRDPRLGLCRWGCGEHHRQRPIGHHHRRSAPRREKQGQRRRRRRSDWRRRRSDSRMSGTDTRIGGASNDSVY
jgi:hypothetical protein